MSQNLSDDLVNIGSVNGFVSPGNKPLPETMLTKIYDWRHMASQGHNKFIAQHEGKLVISQ